MVTRQIEITEAQEKHLEELATRLGRPVPELIRSGIDVLLSSEFSREERRRAMDLSGRFRSGVTDLSTEHDRYLEEALQG
jgi:ribosome-associated translation inhibitor RaiA